MFKFQFENIVELSSANIFSKGMFLWIWQPTKLPPHLGVSVNGKYFSLLYERKQENLTIDSQMELIERKKISMIWQEITREPIDFTQIFERYISCSYDHCSCIQPILDGLQLKLKGGVLFDLLNELKKSNELGKTYTKNLNQPFGGIKKYSRKEVEMYLFKLQD